jgi:hypothetical protein
VTIGGCWKKAATSIHNAQFIMLNAQISERFWALGILASGIRGSGFHQPDRGLQRIVCLRPLLFRTTNLEGPLFRRRSSESLLRLLTLCGLYRPHRSAPRQRRILPVRQAPDHDALVGHHLIQRDHGNCLGRATAAEGIRDDLILKRILADTGR